MSVMSLSPITIGGKGMRYRNLRIVLLMVFLTALVGFKKNIEIQVDAVGSGDTEAPSAVTSFYGSVATLSSVELGIGKAVDNLATASALKYEVFVSTEKTLLFDSTSLVAVLDGSPDGRELTYEMGDLTSGVEYFFGVIAVDPAINKSSPATISSFYLPAEMCEIASFEHFVEWDGFTLSDLTDKQYTYTMTNNAISPGVGDIIVKRINAADDQPHDLQNDEHILIRISSITGDIASGEEVFWGQLITNDCSIVIATGEGVASIAAEVP